ncbi:MAG TPA: Ig-like domain-containing protein, partial [Verrucomicrobiota bacterium]|nr:Ig-like domain-containing protein [Verrucomicrobiota bacterium]
TDYSPQRNPIIANTKYDIYLELPLIYFGPANDVTYAWKCDYSGNTNYAGLFYQVGFDDSAWGNCWMLFEWKNGTPPALPEPIGTLVPIAGSSSTNITYYFRKHFNFPALANTKSAELRLRFVIDDGAIFYMNGSEVYAVRMPTTRPMPWGTQASSSVGDAAYEPAINASAVVQPYYVITNGYLLNGDNLMAVEVHQNGTASTDITFGMILTAVVPPIGVAIQPPQIVTQPQSVYTNYGAIVEFSVEATGVAPLYYQWYFNNAPISGANSSILAMTNVIAQQGGSYFVVVTNDGGAVTSQVATLTFLPDTTPPTLVMAVGLLKATNYPPTEMPTYRDILLTFSEPMDAASVQNAANYGVSRQGGDALQISNVVVVNLTNVLLTTVEAREPFANYIVSVSNVKDASAEHNSIVATNFVIYQEVPLVYVANTNQIWKYDMSRTDFGTSWLTVEFDDSGWLNGVQLFLAKRGTPPATIEPIMTRLPDPVDSASQFVRTYYFRTHFTIPDGVDVTNAQLYLRYIIDDGAVFYLNGSEIHAYNMPANRPVSINDSSSTTLGDPTDYMPESDATAVVQPAYLLTVSNGVLKTGDNLIAVEVHQNSGTGSTDAAFAMNLTAVIPPTSGVTPPPTVIISQTFVVNDKIRINFPSQSGWTYTLESAPGLESQNLTWSAVTSVQGDGSVKVLEDTVSGGRKFYRLRAVKN